MADKNRITRKRRSTEKRHDIKSTKIYDLTDNGNASVRLVSVRRVNSPVVASPEFRLKQERNKSPWSEDQSTKKFRPEAKAGKTNTSDPTQALKQFLNSITRR